MNFQKISLFIALVSIPCSIFSEKSAYAILGYEPNVSEIISAHQTHKTPVIGVLGFKDRKKMYEYKFDSDKTFTVTFSFPDTLLSRYSWNPCTIFTALRNINIGQDLDAMALLYTIIQCYKKGHKKNSSLCQFTWWRRNAEHA